MIYAKEFVADTNILINLYGAMYNPENKNMKQYHTILKLIDSGKIILCATPKILNEFNQCKGKRPEVVCKFERFLREYIKLIHFDDADQKEIEKLTYILGHEKVSFTGENQSNEQAILFQKAKQEGERNYADTIIMSEVIVAKLPFLTINKKDFANCKYSDSILKRENISYKPEIFTVSEFFGNELSFGY